LLARGQIKFFRNNLAGCSFAAYAARDPRKFGWSYQVIDANAAEIDGAVRQASDDPAISTLSLVFRDCEDVRRLLGLIEVLQDCRTVILGQDIVYGSYRCLGFRARIDKFESWISGFGPFSFFPKTRQSPHTEVTMRVKPRPAYDRVMKKAPDGVIHLADMDMLGIAEEHFKALWRSSFERVASLLGHKPDLRSAAKTTFTLPLG
jgi:hypothetical protein